MHGYFAGDDALRASDLNAFFADDEIKAILCLRGGYGAARILEQLDYKMIDKHPKMLIEYSDITALHVALFQRSRLVTVHGSMASSFSFSDLRTSYTGTGFLKGITATRIEVTMPGKKTLRPLIYGCAEGRLVGGYLSVIASLTGTPYELDGTGQILLLEDVNESVYRIDRLLNTLWQNGLLKRVNGIVLAISPTLRNLRARVRLHSMKFCRIMQTSQRSAQSPVSRQSTKKIICSSPSASR